MQQNPWNLGQDVPSQTNRGDPPKLDCRGASSRKLLVDVPAENVILKEFFFPHQPLRCGINNTWHWDVGAGVGMRALGGAGVDGEEISAPSQVQTFPLEEGSHSVSSPRIYLFIKS